MEPEIGVSKLKLTKLEAARRQLKTAIELWFADGEPVSVHTLAFAAYEVVHFVSKSRNRSRDLIFDSALIKDEYIKDWNKLVRQDANFFKHADKDADGTIEFAPWTSTYFMTFAILGLELMGERPNDVEATFMFWHYFNRPDMLMEAGRKRFEDGIDRHVLEAFRSLPKKQFFETFLRGRQSPQRPRGIILPTHIRVPDF